MVDVLHSESHFICVCISETVKVEYQTNSILKLFSVDCLHACICLVVNTHTTYDLEYSEINKWKLVADFTHIFSSALQPNIQPMNKQ